MDQDGPRQQGADELKEKKPLLSDAERVYIALVGRVIVPWDGKHVFHVSDAVHAAAIQYASDRSQRALLDGRLSLSGPCPSVAPQDYIGVPEWLNRYMDAQGELFRRLTNANIPWCEIRGADLRRILVIGAWKAELAPEE